MTKLILSVLIVVILSSVPGLALSYRLSRDVIPQHYDIKLQPNIDEDTFRGEVTITLFTAINKDKILMHCDHSINITEVFINSLPAYVEEENDGIISVQFQDLPEIQPGEHRVHFKFNGIYETKFGLLKATYKYGDQTGVLVVNEFQPGYARKAFPCFDEPSFKANFNFRLVTPNDSYIAVSNMPEIAKYSTSAGVIYQFATSIKMSVYLVSIAITEYSYYEEIFDYRDRKLPIRVYTYNASEENNKQAIEYAKKALQFYSDYTGIEYSLPKLDMLEYVKRSAVATETWGLVQFNEGILTESLKIYDLLQISVVIYHEIAHFWFGNLVTNDWWNDLWLQEGLATHMSNKIMENSVTIDMKRIYNTESRNNTRMLSNYLSSSESVEKRFDEIVYIRGSYLWEAINKLVGEEAFQEAIKIYLKDHLYKTATTNDLISVLENQIRNITIRSFMESYIFQTGFPIVNIEYSNGAYILTQTPDRGSRKKWTFPVSYVYENNNTGLIWLDKDIDQATLELQDNSSWIIFNTAQMPGIYLVNYTEDMWRSFLEHYEEIPESELCRIGDNASVLYYLKLINCDIIFQMIGKLQRTIFESLAEVMVNIVRTMSCFETEYEIVTDYLNQLFGEKGMAFFNSTCSENGSKSLNEADYQCARWIKSNLVNFVKH